MQADLHLKQCRQRYIHGTFLQDPHMRRKSHHGVAAYEPDLSTKSWYFVFEASRKSCLHTMQQSHCYVLEVINNKMRSYACTDTGTERQEEPNLYRYIYLTRNTHVYHTDNIIIMECLCYLPCY